MHHNHCITYKSKKARFVLQHPEATRGVAFVIQLPRVHYIIGYHRRMNINLLPSRKQRRLLDGPTPVTAILPRAGLCDVRACGGARMADCPATAADCDAPAMPPLRHPPVRDGPAFDQLAASRAINTLGCLIRECALNPLKFELVVLFCSCRNTLHHRCPVRGVTIDFANRTTVVNSDQQVCVKDY